ncbi:MAG: ATP-binding protein [Myxococcales bacterium]
MNRVALRISLVLLGTVFFALLVVQVFMMWQMSQALEANVPWRERLAAETLHRYLASVPIEARIAAAREVATSLRAPVEIVNLDDNRITRAVHSALVTEGFSFEFRKLFDSTLWVLVPGTDSVLRLGLDIVPPRLHVWRAIALLVGLVLLVAVMGMLVARPLVKRLRHLQEVSVRIARGELGARALVVGNDDLADFARHFNQMAERNQILAEKQRDLMRAVSHELRTPAARIRFSLELLGDADSKQDIERHMLAIDSDLDEIDCLIQELVTLDRLDRKDNESMLSAEHFDVARAVSAEMGRLEPRRAEVEVITRSALPQGTSAAGSERLFRRAIRNLLSNGVRHAKGKLRISLARANGALQLSIDDDGPGIPAFERMRVLEPFARLDPSRSRNSGGLGLGLTIVDRILAAAGGQLTIEDSELGGARVTMSWPASSDSG